MSAEHGASPVPSPFPWDEVLRLALGRLRWSPDALWRATPREIAAAIGRHPGAPEPLLARGLADLMRSYPDRPAGD